MVLPRVTEAVGYRMAAQRMRQVTCTTLPPVGIPQSAGWVDRRWSQDRCLRAGLDGARVARVAATVARMEYKRQVPPVAKVSLRTPGIDHLYPRRRPGSRRPFVSGSE